MHKPVVRMDPRKLRSDVDMYIKLHADKCRSLEKGGANCRLLMDILQSTTAYIDTTETLLSTIEHIGSKHFT